MIRSTGALLSLVLLSATAWGQDTVVAGERGQDLDAVVKRERLGRFWGAVLVGHKGKILLAKGYGYADPTLRPITARSLFEIASTSKQFTAAAVLKLSEQGKLRLEDPIAKHLGGAPPDKARVTIYQLLTHTSGLDTGEGLGPLPTRGDLIRQMLAARLRFKPGSRFEYNNAAYFLLAALVERVAGVPFERYCREHLFEPAGLKDTGFCGDKRLDPKRLTARMAGKTQRGTALTWPYPSPWAYRGAGGVVTTVLDLWHWDRALRDKKVLGAESLTLFHTPHQNGYACGWQVELMPSGSTRVSHSGGVAGYRAQLIRYLQDDAVIVVLTGGEEDPTTLAKRLETVLFPDASRRLDVRFRVQGYLKNKWGVVEVPARTRWRVEREPKKKDWVRLSLTDPKQKTAPATLRLRTSTLHKLVKDLNYAITLRGKRKGPVGDAMDATFVIRPYQADAKGVHHLPRNVRLVVMDAYRGVDEKNRRIVDERVTFIVLDEANGYWSLIVKMGAGAAATLLKQLRELR